MASAFAKNFMFGKAHVKLVVTGSTTVFDVRSATEVYDLITINVVNFSCAYLTYENGPKRTDGSTLLINVGLDIVCDRGLVSSRRIWSEGMDIPDVEILRHEVNALLAEYRPYLIEIERANAARAISASQECAKTPPMKRCFFDTGLGKIFTFINYVQYGNIHVQSIIDITTRPGENVLTVEMRTNTLPQRCNLDLPVEEGGKCPKLTELMSMLNALGYQ